MPLDAKFFQPEDILGVTADGLVLQSGPNASDTSNEAVVLGPNGDLAMRTVNDQSVPAIQRYGRAQTATQSYIITAEKINVFNKLAPGVVLNDWHIDSIRLSMTNDNWPTLEVSCHKHIDGVPDAGCRVYGGILTADTPLGFGVNFLSAVMVPDTLAVTGQTIEVTCNHVDEFGGQGEHIAGDNYDGTATLTLDCTGSGEVTAVSPLWVLDSASDSDQSNTTAQKKQFVFKFHMPGHTTQPTE